MKETEIGIGIDLPLNGREMIFTRLLVATVVALTFLPTHHLRDLVLHHLHLEEWITLLRLQSIHIIHTHSTLSL